MQNNNNTNNTQNFWHNLADMCMPLAVSWTIGLIICFATDLEAITRNPLLPYIVGGTVYIAYSALKCVCNIIVILHTQKRLVLLLDAIDKLPTTIDELEPYNIQTPVDMAFIFACLHIMPYKTLFGHNRYYCSFIVDAETDQKMSDLFQQEFGVNPEFVKHYGWYIECLAQGCYDYQRACEDDQEASGKHLTTFATQKISLLQKISNEIWNISGNADRFSAMTLFRAENGKRYIMNMNVVYGFMSDECRDSAATQQLLQKLGQYGITVEDTLSLLAIKAGLDKETIGGADQ